MRVTMLLSATILSLCCMVGPSSNALAGHVGLLAQADTNLSEQYPNNNYATNQYLYATLLSNSGKSMRPVIQFDLSNVNAAVNTATLRLFCQGSGATVTVYRMTSPNWTDTKATWNKFDKDVPTNWTNGAGGDYDNTVSASATTGTGSPFAGWIDLDVTDLVQDMVDNGQTTGAVLVCSNKAGTATGGGDGTYVHIRSKESTTYSAKLIINSSAQPNIPAVTAVSGTVADGQHLTVSGSCFGTGPNVVLFDNFSTGTDGQTHSTTATIGTWSTAVGKIFADTNLSNGKGLRVVDTTQLSSVVTFTQTNKVFYSFVGYVPDGYKFPYTTTEETYASISALKCSWLMYTSEGYAHTHDPDIYGPGPGIPGGTLCSNDATGGLSTYDTNSNVGWQWDTPVRWSIWAKGNGTTIAGSDGLFQATNGTEQINRNYTEYKAWFNTDHTVQAWDRINFVGYLRTGTGYTFADGVNFVVDDIYVATGDNAQARMEIGNADTYAACTKLTLVTTGGTGDSWSSTSVTATVREGTLTQTELETGYLYVTNGDGLVNAEGYSLESLSYHLTVNSGTGDGDYPESTVVNIAADSPATGYVFNCWTGNTTGIANVNASSTTITMPAADATITATYTAVPHSLTVNSGTGDGNYTIGTVVDITADAPATGYAFDCWTGDTSGIYDVDDPTTTITMPAANTTITASYVAVPHSLTVNSGTGDGNHTIGQVIDIAADAPAQGYVFDCWTGDTTGIADIYDPTTTITMPAANTAITASYVESTPEDVTLYTQADNCIMQDSANGNAGANSYLYTTKLSHPTNKSRRTLLQFDVSSVHPQVNSATLRIYMKGSNCTLTTYRMTRTNWVEAQSTWNVWQTGSNWTTAGGDYDSSISASANGGTTANWVGWVDIDVTDLVQDMIDNSQTTGSFLTVSNKEGTGTGSGDGTYCCIYSKEYSSTYKAQLLINSQE